MSNPDTKTRILDAAEALFADRGFAATSLRDITAGAGVNLAAVNYHFGSKEALLGAIFERRVAPTNRDRLTLLDEVEAVAEGQGLDPERVVRAFLIPPFRRSQEWGERGAKFMQLVGRTHSEQSELARSCFLKQFGEVSRRFRAAFARALPHLSETEVLWRMHFMIGLMAHTMAWGGKLGPLGQGTPLDPEGVLDRLVQFAVAGMIAPALTTSDEGARV